MSQDEVRLSVAERLLRKARSRERAVKIGYRQKLTMKRTQEYFRKSIKEDVENLATKVVENLAKELMDSFVKKNIQIDMDLERFPVAKRQEILRAIHGSRLSWLPQSLMLQDISEIIQEEVALFLSQGKLKSKTAKSKTNV